MSDEPKTLVTKGQYAQLKGRSPAAVSNWIAEGKITVAAIEGTGQRAKIWVEQADRDLTASLDADQQDRQAAPVMPVAALPSASLPVAIDDIARKRKADADAAELVAEERRRKQAADSGKWVEAEAARKTWAQELTRLVSDMEVFVTSTLATEIAGQFQLDAKQVAVACREHFRSYREGVADTAATQIAEMAEAA